VALLLGGRLHVAHVGDSRRYLHTEEKFEAITNDHSLGQRLQDVGQLTAEEATVYRYRNVLLRAVGQGEEVEIDTYMRLLPKKGKLLLCSDGLCGFVSDDVMNNILKEDKPIQQMVDDLYNAAMAANSNDNVTVILVEFSL
jgi:protein phosphatase